MNSGKAKPNKDRKTALAAKTLAANMVLSLSQYTDGKYIENAVAVVILLRMSEVTQKTYYASMR